MHHHLGYAYSQPLHCAYLNLNRKCLMSIQCNKLINQLDILLYNGGLLNAGGDRLICKLFYLKIGW